MRRLVTWLAGGLGAAALVRELLRRQEPVHAPPAYPAADAADPAEELRAKLEQARGAADDRDEFDAAEGTPVNEVEALPAEVAPAEMAPAEMAPAEMAQVEVESADVEPAEAARADEGSDEEGRSLEERRRAVHAKAQEALGHMRNADDE